MQIQWQRVRVGLSATVYGLCGWVLGLYLFKTILFEYHRLFWDHAGLILMIMISCTGARELVNQLQDLMKTSGVSSADRNLAIGYQVKIKGVLYACRATWYIHG